MTIIKKIQNRNTSLNGGWKCSFITFRIWEDFSLAIRCDTSDRNRVTTERGSLFKTYGCYLKIASKENAAAGFVSGKVGFVGIVAIITSRYFITRHHIKSIAYFQLWIIVLYNYNNKILAQSPYLQA